MDSHWRLAETEFTYGTTQFRSFCYWVERYWVLPSARYENFGAVLRKELRCRSGIVVVGSFAVESLGHGKKAPSQTCHVH